MKKLGILAIAVVVLLLAALFILPSLVPADVYRTRLQSELSNALGRDVALAGDVSISTFPVIKARTEGVRVANAEGFSEDAFIAIESLDARVKLWPLLSKRVEISSFTLIRPVIALERKADGDVNWTLGEDTEAAPDGPFKRDGRFTNIDPQIAAFKLVDGQISYTDAVNDQSHVATNINARLSLPGLDKTLNINGDMVIDGIATDIGLAFDTPSAFLSGLETPFSLDLKMPFADISGTGKFLASQNMDVSLSLEATISDMLAASKLLPDLPYDITPISNANLNGDVSYIEGVTSLRGSTLRVSGTDVDVSFAGDATLGETILATGDIAAEIRNFALIKPYLETPQPAFDLLKTGKISGQLNSKGQTLTLSSGQGSLAGPGLSATVSDLTTSLGNAPTGQGKFTANIQGPERLRPLLPDTIPSLADLTDITSSGTFTLNSDKSFNSNLMTTVKGEGLDVNFNGEASFADAPSVNGTLKADINDAGRWAAKFAPEVTQAKLLGKTSFSGKIKAVDAKDWSSRQMTFNTVGPELNANFEGNAEQSGEELSVNGRFTSNIPNVPTLTQALGYDIANVQSLGSATASGMIATNAGVVSLKDLTAVLTNGAINGRYTGQLTALPAVSLNGRLEATVPSVRQVAKDSAIDLPPGDIFKSAAFSGRVTGQPENLSIDDANVTFDNITATGALTVKKVGERSKVDGNLALNALNLNPYLEAYSAQRDTGALQPWSDTPFNLAGLRAFDADLKLTTPSVKMTRLALGQTSMTTTLNAGVLRADVPNLQLYGGSGRANMTFDASRDIAELDLSANVDKLQGQSFLSAIAGFTNASGQAKTETRMTARGRSQSELMQSLSGTGSFGLLEGALSGIDVSSFMSGLDTALASRQLPLGLGSQYKTTFQDLTGAFSVENGVATINAFNLNAGNVLAEAQGSVDVGKQTLDFSLRPRLEAGSGLAKFGIPIRFSGGFGSAKPSLDTNFLGEIAQARAKAEATKVITDRVGGPVGDILGGILGGKTPVAPVKPIEPNVGDTSSAPATDPGVEPTTPEPKPEETTTEEDVAKALIGIFGKKKKDKEE